MVIVSYDFYRDADLKGITVAERVWAATVERATSAHGGQGLERCSPIDNPHGLDSAECSLHSSPASLIG